MRTADLFPLIRSTLLLAAIMTAPAAQAAAEDNCRLQLSQGKVDYGDTTRAQLLTRQVTPLLMALGKQTVILTASCKSPTLMTLFFRGDADDSNNYRLGGGGNFSLRVMEARLDGRSVGLGNVQVAGQLPEIRANSVALPPSIGAVPIVNDVPVKGSTLWLRIEIDARITNTGSRVADRTTFRSNGNFELQEN